MSHFKTRRLLSAFLIISFFIINSQIEFFTPTKTDHSSTTEVMLVSDCVSDAARISSIALRSAKNFLRSAYEQNITELDVTNYLDAIMRAEGSDGELSYPTYVITRDEADKPYSHSNDDAYHVLVPDLEPLVTIRAGARVNGQCCDVYRTYLFESATQEMIDAYQTILDTQQSILLAIAPGVSVASLDTLLREGLSDYIALPNMSYSYYWGHGVGDYAFTEPVLSVDNGDLILDNGKVLTIQIWLHKISEWYVRLEDTIRVITTGVEVLSDAPKEINQVNITPDDVYVISDSQISSYEFNSEVSIIANISDTANRSIESVSFFNGVSWNEMARISSNSYTNSYYLNYQFPSLIRSLQRIEFSNETIYTIQELRYELQHSYLEVFEPEFAIVVEQSNIDTPFRYAFSKVGAEMLCLNFSKLYPPPGDQFLVRDAQGNVIYEYKWNLGVGEISPWVPGNLIYVDIVPTTKSEYGGVNHFFFRVNMMWMYDSEYIPSTTTTTTAITTKTTDLPTTTETNTTTNSHSLSLDSMLMQTGIIISVILLALYLKKR